MHIQHFRGCVVSAQFVESAVANRAYGFIHAAFGMNNDLIGRREITI